MCKGSAAARRWTNATQGQNLEIGMSAHGLASFHEKDTQVNQAVICVLDGTQITLKSIPLDLQKKHGIGAMALARFIDTGDDKQDFVQFANGIKAPLSDFADKGITAYVGVLDDVAPIDPAAGVEEGVGEIADNRVSV